MATHVTRTRRAPARVSRRRWAACSTLAVMLAVAGRGDARPSDAQASIARAEMTLAATTRFFGTADATGLYHDRYPADRNGYSAEWPFSQVHVGVLDLACAGPSGRRHLADLDAHRRAQMSYWTTRSANGRPGFESIVTPPHGRGGDLYYDDNEWVGLAAIQHWRCFHDTESLKLAEQIFDLVRSAWDTNGKHAAPGGLFWTQAPGNKDRNTVSTMPAAELGVQLHEATGDRAYLDDALRFYTWTNTNLQRGDGLYVDHLDLRGKVDDRLFTYNQGVPVGVNVLLYKATGDAHYLVEARRIADASFAYFVASGRIDRQSMAFNAIYFKNLLLLESVDGGTRFHDAMRDYSSRMWRRHRNATTGLFESPRARGGGFHVIDQGAMIQIDAVLGWDPASYPLIY